MRRTPEAGLDYATNDVRPLTSVRPLAADSSSCCFLRAMVSESLEFELARLMQCLQQGVNGLWQLLSPVARPVALETLEKRRLAIDASIWLYQFQMATRDRKTGDVIQGAHVSMSGSISSSHRQLTTA